MKKKIALLFTVICFIWFLSISYYCIFIMKDEGYQLFSWWSANFICIVSLLMTSIFIILDDGE